MGFLTEPVPPHGQAIDILPGIRRIVAANPGVMTYHGTNTYLIDHPDKNQAIGCRVTLRGDAMYEFYDRLVATALPRIRDFRGLSPRKFDGRGNYTFGVPDQTIFPEIELEKIKRQQGMDITIVTTAGKNDLALDLLKLMGFPFAEK